MSLQTRSSILPVLVNRLCLPSLLIPPVNCPGWGPWPLARRHAVHPNGSGRDVVHYALLAIVDMVFHSTQTSLLECLLKRGVDPAAAWASVGHHVCHSSSCLVMEALQHSPHSICHGPRFTTKKQHSLHHSLDTGVSTFSTEEVGKLVPFVAGPPEVGAQGRPIRMSTRFHSSWVPERAHTLHRCTINSEDLFISPKGVVGYVSTPLGNPTSDTGS